MTALKIYKSKHFNFFFFCRVDFVNLIVFIKLAMDIDAETFAIWDKIFTIPIGLLSNDLI